MKLILENWKRHLKENTDLFPYEIYCDMDGVLVDFIGGAIEQINRDLQDETITGSSIDRLRKKLGELNRDSVTAQDLSKMDKKNRLQSARRYMYSRLQNNEEFWANIPPTSDGLQLWSYISKFNPYILTAPMQGEGSKRGKELWIEEHLNPIQSPKEIFMSHEKYNWAVDDLGQPNVLIDDFETNTIPWKEHGGIAILHTSTSDTIQQLEELINEASA